MQRPPNDGVSVDPTSSNQLTSSVTGNSRLYPFGSSNKISTTFVAPNNNRNFDNNFTGNGLDNIRYSQPRYQNKVNDKSYRFGDFDLPFDAQQKHFANNNETKIEHSKLQFKNDFQCFSEYSTGVPRFLVTKILRLFVILTVKLMI